MKHLFLALLFSLAFSAQAQDMSHTEDAMEVYQDTEEGYSYIGACSTHEHYSEKYFTTTEVLVEYFEPTFVTKKEFKNRLRFIEKSLIKAVALAQGDDLLERADDLTIEKIKNLIFPHLNLYRLNIGVGGGNGMYLVFSREEKGTKVHYRLVSDTFDGDVNFCDRSVWLVR